MADILELSEQYRVSGIACRQRLQQLKAELDGDDLSFEEEIVLRRRITILTAMTRQCLETANYLEQYYERRKRLEKNPQQPRKQRAGRTCRTA